MKKSQPRTDLSRMLPEVNAKHLATYAKQVPNPEGTPERIAHIAMDALTMLDSERKWPQRLDLKISIAKCLLALDMYATDAMVMESELEHLKRATGFCEEHKPTGGNRSCLVCACTQLIAALSKISLLCGSDPKNPMGVSDFDMHASPAEVVKQVERILKGLMDGAETE